MTTKQLEYFIAIATIKNFTKAAQKLYISQPALSSHIKQLETELKIQLFIRKHRYIELTPAGELFLIRAKGLLAYQQSIIHEIQELSESQKSNLHFGLMTGNIYRNIPDLLVSYKEKNPGFSYKFTNTSSSQVFEGVRNHTFDIGLTLSFFDNSRETFLEPLNYEELVTSSIYAVLPSIHPLSRERALTLNQLSNETVINSELEYAPYNYDLMIQCFKKFNLHHKNLVTCSSDIFDTLNMVRSNLGICFLAKEFLPNPIKQLKFIPLKEQIIVNFIVIWDEQYLAYKHHSLIAYIKNNLSSL